MDVVIVVKITAIDSFFANRILLLFSLLDGVFFISLKYTIAGRNDDSANAIMKANAISNDIVFSPVLFFNSKLTGSDIDNVANTIVNVATSTWPTFLNLSKILLFSKFPLNNEVDIKINKDNVAIIAMTCNTEGGEIIFLIKGT
ncbi:hypothetical protein [Xenorhabdus sp. Sc-CR9]|uniref:hypothetical protein n=1 Tax=Xenorhabdus sp. Sc-CR9 TaxID=2584468 RepID=UPI001F24582D|nr:hypothetical protein [Xenorhabdus sp. Sc-CR9]